MESQNVTQSDTPGTLALFHAADQSMSASRECTRGKTRDCTNLEQSPKQSRNLMTCCPRVLFDCVGVLCGLAHLTGQSDGPRWQCSQSKCYTLASAIRQSHTPQRAIDHRD
eukprot:c15810_g2_i2.p2 GENE.c15810_g2_i2~~c15810_g2_i2.p2  ORF type:complete len:111 (+),score=11.06 c15810_g2_i2:437-769(+)